MTTPDTAGERRVEAFADLAAHVRGLPARLGAVRLVAVDGPSAAGKTRFAARLAAQLGGAPIVHTDDLLDGWDDQFTFWERLQDRVLVPLRRGQPASYQRYLWHRKRFGGVPRVVAPGPVIVLEGVTAARAEIRPELTLAAYVTAPAAVRLARSLERDGEALRPYLDRWRAGEDRHFAADRTAAAAGLLVDGAPRIAHDPESHYVRLVRNADRA